MLTAFHRNFSAPRSAWSCCRILALVVLLGASATAQSNIVSGSGTVVGSNIAHPNGQIYDQVLMAGPTVTLAADAGQVVRVSFLDLTDDIVQVEFAGAGTVTVDLDPASYQGPAVPQKYAQPGVSYVKGRPTVRVSGAGMNTFVAIFSVGRGNAVNQSLFPAGMTYDGMADVKAVHVQGAEMGAILTGNVRYGGDSGAVGIHAPSTSVRYRVIVGDVDAQLEASPLLRLGTGSALEWDTGAVLIAGGTLHQSNGAPIDAGSGSGYPLARITAVDGTKSNGDRVAAATIAAEFASKQSGQVSVNGTPKATRGYVANSFDELMNEVGFGAFDFGPEATVEFSGGNQGTYVMVINTVIEGELVQARLEGGYSYSANGTNAHRMTFSMTLATLQLTSASLSFLGTIQQLATMAGEPLPVRITAVADFDSLVSGTTTMTIAFTSGPDQSSTSVFDLEQGLDFSFL